ncbi:hypothetical protein BDV98DRAFT_606872 [Pterulicium gracile]|uniref:Uncharacterized protein n=1 Tax=Pterulicium gracile TaxID=1884261 RepID=A0A5C3QCY9_9AGAR|nr:hypothetical protein BDV98DRAFT_606872 [Pterula gracilis]
MPPSSGSINNSTNSYLPSTPSSGSTAITPISPFSNPSVHSEATSDEVPDLGAFPLVFRALNNLQPIRVPNVSLNQATTTSNDHHHLYSTTSSNQATNSFSRPSSNSNFTNPITATNASEPRSTVWAYPGITSYLASATVATASSGSSTQINTAGDDLRSPYTFPQRSQHALRCTHTLHDSDLEDDDDVFLDIGTGRSQHAPGFRPTLHGMPPGRREQEYDTESTAPDEDAQRLVEIESLDEHESYLSSSSLRAQHKGHLAQEAETVDDEEEAIVYVYDSDDLNEMRARRDRVAVEEDDSTDLDLGLDPVITNPTSTLDMNTTTTTPAQAGDSANSSYDEDDDDEEDETDDYDDSDDRIPPLYSHHILAHSRSHHTLTHSHSMPLHHTLAHSPLLLMPDLGMLDSALSYLASERQRFVSTRKVEPVTAPDTPLSSLTTTTTKNNKLFSNDAEVEIVLTEDFSARRKAETAPVTPAPPFLPASLRKRKRRKKARKVPITGTSSALPGVEADGEGKGEAEEEEGGGLDMDTVSVPTKKKTKKKKAEEGEESGEPRRSPSYAPAVMQILKHTRSTPTLNRHTSTSKAAVAAQDEAGIEDAAPEPETEDSPTEGRKKKTTKAMRPGRKERERLRVVQANDQSDSQVDPDPVDLLDEQEFNMDVLGLLTQKLLAAFPGDKHTLKGAVDGLSRRVIHYGSESAGESGVEKGGQEPYVHVFIDHSNILIGMLNHTRKRPGLHLHRGHHRRQPSATSSMTAVSQSLPTTSVLSSAMHVKAQKNTSVFLKQPQLITAVYTSQIYPSPTSPGSSSASFTSPVTRQLKQTSPLISVPGIANPMSPRKGSPAGHKRHLCHAALALILERGRNVTRRVCVASSPLHQPKESMEQLGYDFKTLKRVLVDEVGLGSGVSTGNVTPFPPKGNVTPSAVGKGSATPSTLPASASGLPSPFSGGSAVSSPITIKKGKKGHYRKQSSVSYDESDSSHLPTHLERPHPAHSISFPPAQPQTATPTRPRYHEQGVDELLQLKLHQSLNTTDTAPPPGSTIVLATGDGNAGEFNEEGFVGPVSVALRRGWRVELYAWEDGLSRVWKREFGEWMDDGRKGGKGQEKDPRRGMFRIVGLEQFGGELVKYV